MEKEHRVCDTNILTPSCPIFRAVNWALVFLSLFFYNSGVAFQNNILKLSSAHITQIIIFLAI